MRLTKKYSGENKLYANSYVKPDYEDSFDRDERCINKLGQLEDLEERLGTDLITLFKALNEGAWFNLKGIKGIREKDQIMFIKMVSIGSLFQLCGWYKYDNKDRQIICLLEQYGKTWALTKEELI